MKKIIGVFILLLFLVPILFFKGGELKTLSTLPTERYDLIGYSINNRFIHSVSWNDKTGERVNLSFNTSSPKNPGYYNGRECNKDSCYFNDDKLMKNVIQGGCILNGTDSTITCGSNLPIKLSDD